MPFTLMVKIYFPLCMSALCVSCTKQLFPSFPLNCLDPFTVIIIIPAFLNSSSILFLYCQGAAVSIGYTLVCLRLRLFQPLYSACLYLCTAVVVAYVIHAQCFVATLAKTIAMPVPGFLISCIFESEFFQFFPVII